MGGFRPAALFQSDLGAIVASPMALLPGARLAFLDARMEPSMLSQTLQLTPYIAIAAGILLGTAIGIICYRQLSRRVGSGISWRQAIFGARFSRLGVIIHDPDLSKPHDLDDPFFDPKVRERVGAMIANAARTK